MKKYCKALVNIAVAAAILAAVLFLLPRVFVFFMPFVAGWIVALMAGPLVHFFEEKIKLKRKAGSAFVIIVIIALVVLLIYVVCAQLFQQVSGLLGALPEMLEGVEEDFNSIGKSLNGLLAKLPGDIQLNLQGSRLELDNYMGDLLEHLGSPTIEAAGNLAKVLPGIFIGVIMALLSAYFFVAERHQLNDWFRKYMPASVQMRYRIIRRSLGKSVGGYFKAQLKIEVWMYFLLLIGLGILRVNYFGLIALGIAFLDFLPFLGTGTVLIPWAVIRILTAQYKTAIGLLVIWGVGQLARQLIQPKIVGDSIGVPPLPTLFLLYIGYKLGGVLGMILAVPLGLLVYSLYEEGAFDTTKNSILILTAGINRFRRLDKGDMSEVEEMNRRNEETARMLARESRSEKN
ncbi:MAG: sporulation integral membrane protein YtvI [Lachnospiraceae bacterium]|nr:sporulation integral membrane protein YtvI [uncultured Acetatifactor sp.]MCI9219957.1 sporulation integral membrane protein YtvI [Lachnospiraceae bacterium]